MIYVLDCKENIIYYYTENKEKENVKLKEKELYFLKILANGDAYSLKDLGVLLNSKKRSLYYFNDRYQYYGDIRRDIHRLRKKGFDIKTISDMWYRLDDIIFIK